MNTNTEYDEKLLKNRLRDLADSAYKKNIYTHTDFLTLAEQEIYHEIDRELGHIPHQLTGGFPDAERKLVIFGNEELFGYVGESPICAIRIAPLMQKFADELTHRDFLGALLNLGIERRVLGDIIIRDNEAVVMALTTASEFICEELTRIKHTSVSASALSLEDYSATAPAPEFIEIHETVASERADLIMAKVTRLSRSKILEFFDSKLVTLNGRTLENNSIVLKPGDVFSIRGYGKYAYDGSSYVTKKGKLSITVRQYK